MKNIYLSLIVFLLLIGSASAQISLVSTGYVTSPVATDSLKVTTAAAVLPSFAPATNATWNLATLTDSSVVLLDYNVAASAPATYADSGYATFGGYSYQGNTQMAVTSGALEEFGINIIGSINPTGTTGDTITIPNQNDTFSTARAVIKFPATMSTSWTCSYVQSFNFLISYVLPSPLPPLVREPGMVKAFATETDTVIGWGKMRVVTTAGTPSGYINVLQVRNMRTTVDSFYLNGSSSDPLLPSLLTLFGATQGSVSKSYSQNFYRIDNVTPLATVKFSDSANTMPTKVTTNAQRLPANAVTTIANDATIRVYPNPVSGNVVTVSLPATAAGLSYELIDINGRKVTEGSFPPNATEAQVTLPSSMVNGIYYLKLNNNGTQVSATPIELVR